MNRQTEQQRSYLLHGNVIVVPRLEAGLHVVATPIGHLEDITLRALKALAGADIIACEDTRVTAKLLQRYGIKRPLLSYHEHNAGRQGETLLGRMGQGEAVVLVSDAGTPLLSDPGERLVASALAQNLNVTAYPGASALLAALVSSGLPAEEFHFLGFLPAKQAARRKALQRAAEIPGTLIFYETAPRLAACLADMDVLGKREICICRELTKLHEEVVRGLLDTIAEHFAQKNVKGEIVIVAGPCHLEKKKEDPVPLLDKALRQMSAKEAVAHVAQVTGLPRRDIYTLALKMKGKP